MSREPSSKTKRVLLIRPSPPASLACYQSFKKFEKRILVATNLFGRGMDIEKVRLDSGRCTCVRVCVFC